MDRHALMKTTTFAKGPPMVRMLLGLLMGLAATSAWSQNAVVGKQLYLNTNGSPLSCGSAGACHGPDPALRLRGIEKGTTGAAILNAINSKNEMKFLANAPYTVSAQQAADIAAYIVNPAAANSPALSVSATALTFASTQIAVANSTSMPAGITVTNSGGAALTISGIAKGGANAADFSATGSCVGASVSVPAGGTCTLSATFTPAAAGTRSATFVFQSNAASNPTITLSGTGAAAATPSLMRSVTSITFNSQTIGTTSAVRAVVLTNNGTMPVSITQVAAAPTPEFAATGACVGTLAAGASCTMNVTFTPSASGMRNGNLTITSNATGSPHAVTLTGPGVLTPTGAAAITSSALSFPQTVVSSAATPLRATLTNTGNAVLNITSVTIAGANAADFRLGAGNTCAAGALAVNASCQVEAEFRPTSAGNKTADVVVAHSAGTTTVALGGMAAEPAAATAPAPAAAPSSSALAPSNVGGGGAVNPSYGVLLLLSLLAVGRRERRPMPR